MVNGEGRVVLMAGGGSAGHVSPLLAIADAVSRRAPGVKIVALGTESGLEARLVPQRGYQLETIAKVPMPRKLNKAAFTFPGAMLGAFTDTDALVKSLSPDTVVGMGGYVSTPAYLAARRRGVPIVIHEQNALPGMANKLGARFTPHVLTTFDTTSLPGAKVVGMPMRTEITSVDRAALRDEALSFFDLKPDAKTLLVTGGSLGAASINRAMQGAKAALHDADVQVLHITGRGKSDGLESGPGYQVIEYVDRMDLAYAAADLVLCRSGANTVCELTAVGLPALYVPLPIGNGEQRFNAEPVVSGGGGKLIDDADLSAERVVSEVTSLTSSPEALSQMAQAASSWGKRDADNIIADIIIGTWR